MALRYDTKTGKVEADTPDELVAAIRALDGKPPPVAARQERTRRRTRPGLSPGFSAPAAPTPTERQEAGQTGTSSTWTATAVRAYFDGVRPVTRAALILLVRNPEGLTSSAVAKHVGMNSARGIGSIFNGIKRGAVRIGMPNPLVVVDRRESGLPVAKLHLDRALVAATTPILDEFAPGKEAVPTK